MSTPTNNGDIGKNIDEKLCCVKEQIQNINKNLCDCKNIIIFCITSLLILVIIAAGIAGIFYNCCEKKYTTSTQKPQNNPDNPKGQIPPEKLRQNDKPNICNQCIDNIEADFTLKNKIWDSSFNLSTKGQQGLNSRSDCFWFIIFFITSLLLVLLFHLIAVSSRESKLLQFIIDWNEQENKKN